MSDREVIYTLHTIGSDLILLFLTDVSALRSFKSQQGASSHTLGEEEGIYTCVAVLAVKERALRRENERKKALVIKRKKDSKTLKGVPSPAVLLE